MTGTGCVIVLTTIGAGHDAGELAGQLVGERLAACVNVGAEMLSVYRWKGAVESDRERQLVVKTTEAMVPALMTRLRELHPYEVPELLVVPVVGGSDAYLAWVKESVG